MRYSYNKKTSVPRTFFTLKLMPTRWMGTLQTMPGGLTAHLKLYDTQRMLVKGRNVNSSIIIYRNKNKKIALKI